MTSNENCARKVFRQLAFYCCVFVLLSATCATAQILRIDNRDHRLKLELKSDWLPNAAEVAHVESLLKMPPKVGKLQDYERYWVGTSKNGRKQIYGYLDSETPRSLKKRSVPQLHIVKYAMLEIVWDAGCATIDVDYDVFTDRLLSHQCGGSLAGHAGPPGWRGK